MKLLPYNWTTSNPSCGILKLWHLQLCSLMMSVTSKRWSFPITPTCCLTLTKSTKSLISIQLYYLWFSRNSSISYYLKQIRNIFWRILAVSTHCVYFHIYSFYSHIKLANLMEDICLWSDLQASLIVSHWLWPQIRSKICRARKKVIICWVPSSCHLVLLCLSIILYRSLWTEK